MQKIIFSIIIILITSNLSCNLNNKKKFKAGCYEEVNNKIQYTFHTDDGEIKHYILSNANPKKFKIINKTTEICNNADVWAKDSVNVYYKNQQLLGADVSSFKVLSNGYSCDKNKVYFRSLILKDADINSFKVLSNFYAKDKNRLWFCEKEVSGIENITDFNIIDGYFSKNDTFVFFNNDTTLNVIKNVHAESFREIEDSAKSNFKFYKDKNNTFVINTELKYGDTGFFKVVTDTIKN